MYYNEELLKAVYKFNNELLTIDNNAPQLNYIFDGYIETVVLYAYSLGATCEFLIWYSEDDQRKEGEDYYTFFKRKWKEIIKQINKWKIPTLNQ